MPRITSTEEFEDKVVKKTPRKRAAPKKAAAKKTDAKKPAAPKATTAKKVTPRRATSKATAARKTTPRKTKKQTQETQEEPEELNLNEDENDVEESEGSEVTQTMKASTRRSRKAPTKFSTEAAKARTKRNQMIVVAVLMSLGIGSSAAVGFTDDGQINVAQTIKERNERMANLVDVDGPTVTAPVPTPSRVPDGGFSGLRPAEQSSAPAPVATPVTASSTATSTPATGETASSTASTTDTTVETESVPQIENDLDRFASDTATTTVEAVDPNI